VVGAGSQGWSRSRRDDRFVAVCGGPESVLVQYLDAGYCVFPPVRMRLPWQSDEVNQREGGAAGGYEAPTTKVDRVSATFDPTGEVSAFRRAARALQTKNREATGSPIGIYQGKPNGAVLDEVWEEFNRGANFLSDDIVAAVEHRLANPVQNQQLERHRLRRHMLGSMPMCFNLFGELSADSKRFAQVGRTLFGLDAPGMDVRFEWSPGRRDRTFTRDQTAFDVALAFGRANAGILVGIETKYHEWAEPEHLPHPTERLPRYREIAETSGIFKRDWESRVLGKPIQQIWRDHLLLLSLLQQDSGPWVAGKYVLVYPKANPSFRDAAVEYRESLLRGQDESTFLVLTLEEVLDGGVLGPETEARFRARYLW
jgi:hypothetical protein